MKNKCENCLFWRDKRCVGRRSLLVGRYTRKQFVCGNWEPDVAQSKQLDMFEEEEV